MSETLVAQLHLVTAIRQGLRCQSGQAFQTVAQNILRHQPGDFQPIVPHGRDGDGGNDCYSRTLGIYAQIYAPDSSRLPGRDAARKAAQDFSKIRRKWSRIRPVNEYWFVTNSSGSNIHVESALNEIEKTHNVKVRFLSSDDLADEVAKLSRDRIEELMGFSVHDGGQKLVHPSNTLALLASVNSLYLEGLHLLAALAHKVPKALCEELLSDVLDWKPFWSWLRRHGFGKYEHDLIELDQDVLEQCRKNHQEQKKACQRWARVLVQYGSIDCLYLAALPLATLGRFSEVVRVITKAGLEFESSSWDAPMLELFAIVNKPKILAKLSRTDRLAFQIANAN